MKFINVKCCGLFGLMCLLSCGPAKKMQPADPTNVIVVPKAPTVVTGDGTKTDALLEDILKQYPQYFDSILAHRKDWNVQIIYTQIDRGRNNLPKLTNYYFNVNPSRYFYPASTVKLPTAVLALQRLNELKGTGINKNTTMLTGAGYSGQTEVYNDPTTADGRPTIANYIKKIFLVSDNDAQNRLYEFMGQEYINDQLHKKGYEEAQILHRLQIALSEDENRHTNPLTFLDASNKILYQQPLAFNETKYAERNDSLGKAFLRGGQFVIVLIII